MTTRSPVYEAVRNSLLPRIQRPDGSASRPFSGDLEVGLVQASADGTTPVEWADLEAWGVDFDTACEDAVDNLRQLSHPRRWQDVETVAGMKFYLPGGHDAAARALLIPELLASPAEGILFAVPTPDQLIAVPLCDLEHLEAVRVLVTAAHLATRGTTRALTDQIFWYDGEEIVHVPVVHAHDTVDILAPPELLAAIDRLATFALLPAVAEA